jgi:hypothetical protein
MAANAIIVANGAGCAFNSPSRLSPLELLSQLKAPLPLHVVEVEKPVLQRFFGLTGSIWVWYNPFKRMMKGYRRGGVFKGEYSLSFWSRELVST